MKSLRYRKKNTEINAVYSKYMKVDIDDEINNISFEKALDNCYRNMQEEKEFKSFLLYRYDYLKNEFAKLITLIFILATTCIPAICLSIFNVNAFDNVGETRLIQAVIFAFIVILASILIVSIFTSILVAPWVMLLFSKKSIRLQNDEIGVIIKYLHKRDMVEQINRKTTLIKALKEGALTLVISIVVWILTCLKI